MKDQDRARISPERVDAQLEVLGPLTACEWISLAVLGFALAGWLGKPPHGIPEAWVALGAFLMFLMTGVLDKPGLRNNIDWGFVLFFGVVSGLSLMVPHFKVDQWILGLLGPVLARVSFHPFPFLVFVLVLTYAVRLFLSKFPAIVLLSLGLTAWAVGLGIHPGVLMLTILMAVDCWFLPYQDTNYQLMFYGTNEKAFSHAQGRRLMLAKVLVSLLPLAISIPYWRLLGPIR